MVPIMYTTTIATIAPACRGLDCDLSHHWGQLQAWVLRGKFVTNEGRVPCEYLRSDGQVYCDSLAFSSLPCAHAIINTPTAHMSISNVIIYPPTAMYVDRKTQTNTVLDITPKIPNYSVQAPLTRYAWSRMQILVSSQKQAMECEMHMGRLQLMSRVPR